jgi:Lipocalin-like domain
MRSDRPKFSSNNRLQGTPDDYKLMGHGTIATFGKYTVDEEKKAFRVRFEGSTFPNNEGSEQVRPVTISGDELRIQNPASTIGGTTELVYRWAK